MPVETLKKQALKKKKKLTFWGPLERFKMMTWKYLNPTPLDITGQRQLIN